MTAPVFVVERLEAGVVTVSGDEGRHGATVKRLRVGEAVALTDGRGAFASGPVVEVVGKDRFRVDLPVVKFEEPAKPTVCVVQALIKGDRMDRAIESLVEVGADSISVWQATNSVARVRGEQWSAAAAKFQRKATEAAKQARRHWIPEIEQFSDGDLGEYDAVIVLHESAETPLVDYTFDFGELEKLALVVGPEGGITDAELDEFIAAGAHVARMGPTVMRAGTAGTAALAWILGMSGRWSKPSTQT